MLPVLIVFGQHTAEEVYEAAVQGYARKFSAIERFFFDLDFFSSSAAQGLGRAPGEVYFNVGIADELLKYEVVKACQAQGWLAYSIVHPSAIVSPSASLGEGVFVGPLAVISSNSIVGPHCLIHLHASVGHNAQIGEYSAVLPGARISGNVRVGSRCLIGSNAFVAQGTQVGDDSRIDALAYVHRDVPNGFIVSPRSTQPIRRADFRYRERMRTDWSPDRDAST